MIHALLADMFVEEVDANSADVPGGAGAVTVELAATLDRRRIQAVVAAGWSL